MQLNKLLELGDDVFEKKIISLVGDCVRSRDSDPFDYKLLSTYLADVITDINDHSGDYSQDDTVNNGSDLFRLLIKLSHSNHTNLIMLFEAVVGYKKLAALALHHNLTMTDLPNQRQRLHSILFQQFGSKSPKIMDRDDYRLATNFDTVEQFVRLQTKRIKENVEESNQIQESLQITTVPNSTVITWGSMLWDLGGAFGTVFATILTLGVYLSCKVADDQRDPSSPNRSNFWSKPCERDDSEPTKYSPTLGGHC